MRVLLVAVVAVAILAAGGIPAYAGDPLQTLAAPAGLGVAINDVYTFAIEIVGLCVFIMFLLAGLSYILPDAVRPKFLGNPQQMMLDSVIGLVLLFSSYLILKTLNPALVGESNTATSGTTTGSSTQTEARPLPANP